MAGFTTIAAGIGAATSLGGGLMSFGQSAKASKQAADAQKKADRLMAQARKDAQKDVYEKLQVPLDAFNELLVYKLYKKEMQEHLRLVLEIYLSKLMRLQRKQE
jgi:regulator of protease activity HflC (stomatin/prohibitin superfamily)